MTESTVNTTEAERALRDAIRSFLHGELTGPAIMRKLVQHRLWRLPTQVTASGPVPELAEDEDGKKWLQVFSDREIFDTARSESDLVLEISGTALFRMADKLLEGVEINPGHGTALHFSSKQFRSLEMWSAAIQIEALLRRSPNLGPHGKALRGFRRFLVLAERSAKGLHLVLVPNMDGKYVAVFTADDAAQRFKSSLNTNLRERTELRAYWGFGLFQELEELGVDGLTFNPAGPGESRTESREFISEMIGVPGLIEADVLLARTISEAHLYMDMCGCPSGARDHSLMEHGNQLISQYTTSRPHDEKPHTFRFIIPEEALGTDTIGGAQPSKILDPAAFLRYADLLADSVPGSPSGLETPALKAAKFRLIKAAECIAEVMKFMPPSAQALDETAFLTEESRSYFSFSPGRFTRSRLNAVADTYQKIADEYAAALANR